MTKDDTPPPPHKPTRPAEQDSRESRLAAALRQNLRRRKTPPATKPAQGG